MRTLRVGWLLIFASLPVGCGLGSPGALTEFKPAGGGFSVLLPAQPADQSRVADSPVGPIPMKMYLVSRKDWAYMVAYNDFPTGAARKGSDRDILNGGRNGLLNGTRSTLLAEREITLGGYPGRELEYQSSDGKLNGKARIYVVDNRLYQVQAMGSRAFLDSEKTGQVLDSFTLLDTDGKPRAKAAETNAGQMVKVDSSQHWQTIQPGGAAPAPAPTAATLVSPGKPRPVAVRPPAQIEVPQPTSGGSPLMKGRRRRVDDLGVTELTLSSQTVLPCLAWSQEGDAFFCLEKDGTVRRVRLADFEEDCRLSIGQACRWLSMSAEGLLVTVEPLQEVWLLNPSSLDVKARIGVEAVDRAVSSPTLSVGFVVGRGAQASSLTVLDLKAGKVVGRCQATDFPSPVGFGLPTVSPDGKALFTIGWGDRLQRFRINGQSIEFDKTSVAHLAMNPQSIAVSPAGDLVAVPSGGGNGAAFPSKAVGPYTTFVFKADTLDEPVMALKHGPFPRTLAFDQASETILAANLEHELIVFRQTGEMVKEYNLRGPGQGGDVTQILAHSDARKALILSNRAMFFVEPPQGDEETADENAGRTRTRIRPKPKMLQAPGDETDASADNPADSGQARPQSKARAPRKPSTRRKRGGSSR